MAQPPDEKTYVEIPFIEQLKGMGWKHIEGDIDVPYLTERESFRDVLLIGRLRKAIKEINLDDGGKPWLDDDRVNEVVSRLERITAPKLTVLSISIGVRSWRLSGSLIIYWSMR
jgi:type I restriction enzyme R subunit